MRNILEKATQIHVCVSTYFQALMKKIGGVSWKMLHGCIIVSFLLISSCIIYTPVVFDVEEYEDDKKIYKAVVDMGGFDQPPFFSTKSRIRDRILEEFNYYKFLDGMTTTQWKIDEETYNSLSEINKAFYKKTEGYFVRRRYIKPTYIRKRKPIFHAYEFCKKNNKKLRGIDLETYYHNFPLLSWKHLREYYVTCTD